MSEQAHRERERFFGAAKVVAALTMLSRILGLVRDMVMIPIGAPALADRFWTAFSIPNLFRRLFGEGALSAAFVPVFTEVAEHDGWDRARVLLANVAGLLGVILSTLMILVWAGLWIAWVVWGGGWLRLFLFQMIALMLPFMLTVCLLALGSAALQCKGRFRYPAFAPIILNVVLIVAAVVVAPHVAHDDAQWFTVLALAVVVAGLLQWFGVILLLRRTHLAMAALTRIRPVLPETKRIGRLMVPMVFPLAVLQISAFADRLIALLFSGDGGPLAPGVVRCLYAANRLYQLPLGVLAISVATVVFPLFSRYAARNDHDGLRDATNRALRLSLFLAIPAGVALTILAGPVIAMIFRRGQFTDVDVARSAWMLQAYCLGMWAYFCNHILLRAFFSVKQPRRPLQVACGLVVVNLALVLIGIHTPLKGAAVGLATAVTSSLNALILIALLRRRWGRLGLRSILISTIRIAVATIGMAMMMWACMRFGERPTIRVILGSAAGAGTYLIVARLLRCRELTELRRGG